jgi:hypothetical protein
MAADLVPWLSVGARCFVVDIDPKAPWARAATVQHISPRRIVTKGQQRYLQAQLVETPINSGHWGYRSISGTTTLVGPDNPHIPMISNYRARTDTLEALKRAWNTLWMARHDEQAMREAAAAMISTLDHYLKDGTK